MINILLVEDDSDIVSNLSQFLSKEGFSVMCASGQVRALQLLSEMSFDLALLDISISDGSGFTLCRAIKSEYPTPVIFLTASSDEYSTLTAFELGGDDYISKPFRPRELVCRIKNILRLTSGNHDAIKLGSVTVDTARGRAEKNGNDLFLSALEYRLLMVFINNRGIVMTRGKLLEAIWDVAGEFVNDNTLTVYIKRLREKIEDDPKEPRLIKTVRGMGYILE